MILFSDKELYAATSNRILPLYCAIDSIIMNVVGDAHKLRDKTKLLNNLYLHFNIKIDIIQYSLVCQLLLF